MGCRSIRGDGSFWCEESGCPTGLFWVGWGGRAAAPGADPGPSEHVPKITLYDLSQGIHRIYLPDLENESTI